jgi:flagellar hook-associated protein 1 FlgK
LAVTARAPGANTGTATIGSGAITANSLLTTHDYEIRFSSATAYSIVDATTGATIKGNYTGTAITAPSAATPLNIITGTNDTLTVTVDGTASGAITLAGAASPGQAYNSGADLATEIQSKINADAALVAAGKSVTVVYDTTTTRFVITSNSTASTSAVNVTGGNARAALGLTAGTSTAASGTYGSPQTFNLDGISVTVSGAAAASDVFTVNARAETAKNIAVALTDTRKVAASSTQAGIPGDNGTALALVALQNKAMAALNSATLNGYYATTAAAVGSDAQATTQNLSAQEVVRNQLDSQRGETSGVSMDEELSNMIKFQRAYQASARLIVTADEMFQALLDLMK